jgi:hypothetical protein
MLESSRKAQTVSDKLTESKRNYLGLRDVLGYVCSLLWVIFAIFQWKFAICITRNDKYFYPKIVLLLCKIAISFFC